MVAEPLVVDEQTVLQAPRIVATQEGRVLLSRGDRAYARGDFDLPPPEAGRKAPVFRVFRNATPLKDPHSGEVLMQRGVHAVELALDIGEKRP